MRKRTTSRFRVWLVDKVSRSRWPYYKDQSDEEIAEKLGVRLDVLHDARAALEERTRKDGLMPGQKLGHKILFAPAQQAVVTLEPPKEIYEEWSAIRDRMRSTNAILVRTVLHAVLQMPTQPAWLASAQKSAWIWKGQWCGQENIRSHLYRLHAKVGDVAHQALIARAQKTNCTPSSIARWGVILFVHGKLPKYSIVSVPRAMYRDIADYCIDPQIVE